jgi:NAD(P)H-flavin reductase
MVSRSNARITDITSLTNSVKLFTLEPETPLTFKAGQFLNLKFEDEGARHMKPYSIASSPQDLSRIQLCIKLVENGRTTPVLFNKEVGTEVQLMGGLGLFSIDKAEKEYLVFAGAGTGVAPLRSMIYELLAQGSEQKMELILGVRHEDEILFEKEFRELEENHSNFFFSPVVSRPSEDWQGKRGYVQHHFDHLDAKKTQVFLCGLPRMIEDAKQQLYDLNFSPEYIHEEKFV